MFPIGSENLLRIYLDEGQKKLNRCKKKHQVEEASSHAHDKFF